MLKRAILFVSFTLLLSLTAIAQGRTIIKIAPESVVKNDIVTLAEIAQISSGSRSEAAGAVSLGYAPNIGTTREIQSDRIVMALAAAGLSKDDYLLNSPPKIRIRRAGQSVEVSSLRESIESAVKEYFSQSAIKYQILRIDNLRSIDVPVGNIEIRAGLSNIQNIFAPFSLPIEIRVDDRIFQRFSVSIEIEAFADVFVATGQISAGSKIALTDVRIENRRIQRALSYYLRDPESLRGLSLIKDVSAGSEITRDSIVSTVVVKSGDLVRIIGNIGNAQISVNGEARSSGKIGDRIAVKNSQSKLVVQATIIDEGLVKVSF